MEKIIEIRWHGRGGQGTVTAAKIFANACLKNGHYVQAFPEYGPERSGAPLLAYNRISPGDLRRHYPVQQPHIVIVVDPTLLDKIDVTTGADPGATFLVNTGKTPEETIKKIRLINGQKLYCVDGNSIAIDCFGRDLPNSALVAALARISGLAELDIVAKGIAGSFGKKFSQELIDANIKAAKKGWEAVCGI